ncbi:terminase large subunit [Asaia siamensis]
MKAETISDISVSDHLQRATPDARAYEQLAQELSIDTLKRQFDRYQADPRCLFDADAARHACEWIETHLRHSKGKMARQPFLLEPWQAMLVSITFGWKWKASSLRVIRTLYLFVPRKNGKSTFGAALALYLLLEDTKAGPEVISAAADREQARIVFKEALNMLAQAPKSLRERTDPLKNAIICPDIMGAYRAISSNAERQHGLNPSAILFDELHTQPDRDLYDVLHTAVGAREQPLEIFMTTAGYDRHSICYEVHSYAVRVRDGDIEDLSFLPVLFGASEEDDWTDPRSWAKANPSLGAAVQLEFLARECQSARERPGYQNTFKRLFLNIWTEQSSRWLDMDYWRACAGPESPEALEERLKGRRCYGGLDLAKTRDFSAWAILFPPCEDDPLWYVLVRFWLPEKDLDQRARLDRTPYQLWANRGLIRITPGNTTDFRFIQAQILEDASTYQIVTTGVDRTFGGEIVQNLQDEGMDLAEVGQGFMSLAAPTAELERLILSEQIRHGGHPVLAWMASNVAVRQDPAGNLKPDKDKSGDKIDGIAATVNALFLAMNHEDEAPFVYEGM